MKDYGEEYKEAYLRFIGDENYKHQIDIWFKAYNISREKIDLYYDFLSSLYNLVNETYLGSDVINTELQQKNHFTWCWMKNIESYSMENIHFKEQGEHYEYFWNMFLEAFYMIQQNDGNVKIPEYLNKLFSFKHVKSRSELDILTELYKLLDQNLKK